MSLEPFVKAAERRYTLSVAYVPQAGEDAQAIEDAVHAVLDAGLKVVVPELNRKLLQHLGGRAAVHVLV